MTIRRWATFAAAACVVAGASFWVGRTGGAARPGTAGHPPDTSATAAVAAALPTPADIARGAETFGQVEREIGPATNWVLVSGKVLGPGMDFDRDLPPDVSAAPPTRLLLLRLRVLRGDVVVADTDIAVNPGRKAELAVPVGDGQELQYTVETRSESTTRLSIWVDLKSSRGKETLSFVSTSIQPGPDGGVSSGRLSTSAGPYELRVAFADAPFDADRARGAASQDKGKVLQ